METNAMDPSVGMQMTQASQQMQSQQQVMIFFLFTVNR